MQRLILIILLTVCFFNNHVQANENSALPFVKQSISPDELKMLCQNLNVSSCQNNDVTLWKIKGRQDDTVYLIDNSTPRLIQLKKQSQHIEVISEWSFKNYTHSCLKNQDDTLNDRERLNLYPALYPINQSQWSVALVYEQFKSYSGGGEQESCADFLSLEKDGQFSVAFQAIPFFSSRMIRACFTEEQYEKSPHCHEESGMTLHLKFKDIGKTYFQWVFTYKNYEWPAFAPKSTMVTQTIREVAEPFQHKVINQ